MYIFPTCAPTGVFSLWIPLEMGSAGHFRTRGDAIDTAFFSTIKTDATTLNEHE